jgi:hypothetical protein
MVRSALTFVTLALLASVVATCKTSNPTNVNDDLGSVSAAMHDSARVLPPGRTAVWPADSMAYDGTLTGSAQVHVYSNTGGWIALHDPVDVSFEIFCREDATITADAHVPVGTYSQVRLTLRGFVAEVDAGGTVDGVVLPDAKTIALGGVDGEIVIEKGVTPFEVTETIATTLVFDLNTDTWINVDIANAGTVSADAVRAGAVVYVKQ